MKIGTMIGCNDDAPPQGLSLGMAGQEDFLHFSFKSLIRRGAPFEGGGVCRIWGKGVSTPINMFELHDFHKKPSKKERGQGSALSRQPIRGNNSQKNRIPTEPVILNF